MSELVPRDDVPQDEEALLPYLVELVEHGRRAAAVQVNATLTTTYWLVGRAVSIHALRDGRADYGKQVVASVGRQLSGRFGPGCGRSDLARTTKTDAEGWLSAERALIDRDTWTPPRAWEEVEARRQREMVFNNVGGYAERYFAERDLRPNTLAGYRQLLQSRILPTFRDTPLIDVTLADIKSWRASLDPKTESTNAAAYRLLRSLLQAAEEDELIDRAPPKIRGASTACVQRVAKPATFDELAVIIEHMPERLKLFIVLAAFVGLREGEALELRRSDVDGVIGRIDVTRKIDKNARRDAPGACRLRPTDQCPKDGERHPDRTRPSFLSADTAEAPARAHRSRTGGTPLPRRPHRPHERPLPHGSLPPGSRGSRAAGPHDPSPPPHRPHPRLTLAGQHGATAAELQACAGHASQAAMAIYQHATLDRDAAPAEKIGATYDAWRDGHVAEK